MPAREQTQTRQPMASDAGVPGDLQAEAERWEQGVLDTFLRRSGETKPAFNTNSGIPIRRLYTPLDQAGSDYSKELGFPGAFPFTRGPYPTMYRGRQWTMRQIAGFGTAAETNGRFRYLIAQGQTGLSVDFDMPTLMGYDSDHPRAFGEVGREGVAIDTLADMEQLFEGIDLGAISVSMTINPTAWILFAMYLAVAEARGIPFERLSGTIQNDILKEYMAQKEWIYPVRPSLRLVRDTIVHASALLPRYNPINISGYHISEAGANAVQEVAFMLADAIAYVEEVTRAGTPVDRFAPRLSYFMVCQSDFFEEVAKFRAARRVYARLMRERFGATEPESMRLRFHTQTAAMSLTKAQPVNNVARTALQALAAVLGGTQSLHTNGMDEAYAIPSEAAMKVALRTQQIIADETNVASTVDPLGGSYYVEALTSEIERRVWAYLNKVDEVGGTIAALERNFFQQEIADTAYSFALGKETAERVVVGVNKYRDAESGTGQIELHHADPDSERRQIANLQRVKRERDNDRVRELLERLAVTARGDENLMPLTIEAVKAQASMGEIVEALVAVWGRYTETPVF